MSRRIRGRARGPVASVALAVLVTACGDGGGDSGGTGAGAGQAATTTARANTGTPSGQLPPGQGSCTLISESEVASAVGVPVKAVGAGSKPEGQVCTFAVPDKTDPPQTVLVVTARAQSGPSAFESARRDAGARAQNVSGIGDRAFVNAGQLVALKGSTVLLVSVGLDGPESTLSQSARKLAEAVIGRV